MTVAPPTNPPARLGPRRTRKATWHQRVLLLTAPFVVTGIGAELGLRLLDRFPPEQVQLFFLLRDVARLRDLERLPRSEIQKALAETLDQPTPGLPRPIRTLEDLKSAFWRYWSYPRQWWEARADAGPPRRGDGFVAQRAHAHDLSEQDDSS